MTDITQFINQSCKHSEIIKEYFRLLPLKSFSYMYRKMHSNNFPLEERKDDFRVLLSLIGQLGSLFKKNIIELNNLARLMGYPNFLEYSLVLDTIPKQKLEELIIRLLI